MSAFGRKRTFNGLEDTRRMTEKAPWQAPVNPMEALWCRKLSARAGGEPKSYRAERWLWRVVTRDLA